MASSTADPVRIKSSMSSNSSQKVRIVGKIRGFTKEESETSDGDSAPWISVRKPNEDGSSQKVTISFGDQSTSHRDVYEVDYCYEQNEDNGMIFSREIKPVISKVFDGHNIAIIAYGARGSGKTYTIQGTEEKPGLAALAIAEILLMAEDTENLVAISFYEVFQDHVYDLLEPTRPEVQVLEDAQGKIKLKGLSKEYVKSVSAFQKLYFIGCSSRPAMQKIPFEPPRKSHKGLIIRILSNNEKSNAKLLGKITFVDLAGYEDGRRKNCEGFNIGESSRVNKSLYALLNVMYALNANHTHLPYRENKLTRMLQDSFGGTNHVLMLTCLNPFFCQDTIYATGLASRSCQGSNRVFTNSTKKVKGSDTIYATGLASRSFQGSNRVFTNSTKKVKGSAKPMVLSSLTKEKLGIVSSTVKKSTSSKAYFSKKNTSSLEKGRKLFDEGNHLSNPEQAKSPSNIASVMQSRFMSDIGSAIVPSLREEEKFISNACLAGVPKTEETSLLDASKDKKRIEEMDVPLHSESNHSEVTANIDSNIKALTYLEDGDDMDKENKSSLMNEAGSPPLSARLRDLSNDLKSLLSLTPIQIEIPPETDVPYSDQVVSADIVELKTPVKEQHLRVKDKWEVANCPSETFSARSSGFKHSLVQDYLSFLNTASKEELKGLRGIGEKRATYILELREESPEPFKNVKGMMKKVAGELFN
ncbi:kinesin-like protein KIN-10C isoform X2 [Camellia sinensis]|uniref:kinesin-like protein KIN-10C isoform X2 n=1 Tax=Camellia sinensis TaxID=4442 RepID=UPI0010365E69|nr:kinesin-like protein KIN-10C isoform X2 [Camellia sinensis]